MNKCIFKEDTHQYFLIDAKTGEVIKELISVTTLLRKHGLAPNYSSVPSATLEAKAEYGQMVHGELEAYIKRGEIGFSNELADFIEYCTGNSFEPLQSEFIVYNDIVAGMVDLLGRERNDCYILGDFKTTAILHKETVRWQLSLYAYLMVNSLETGVNKLQAFHFAKDGLKVVDIDFIPYEEIEKLLEAERNDEIYQKKELVLAGDLMAQVVDVEETIKYFELQKKEAEAKAAELRTALLDAMQTQSVKSFENDRIKITYVEPTTRETIDSKRLKEELPEIAEQYKKISKVKESVRITLK